MPTGLAKNVQEQLENRLPRAYVEDLAKARADKRHPARRTFEILSRLHVYVGTCGSIARSGVGDLKQQCTIALLKSSWEQLLHVELNQSGKQVIRVSSGGAANDLEKAIRRATSRQEPGIDASKLRILRVAALHFSAVWVHHPKKPAVDSLIPYTPNFCRLRIGRRYSLRRAESVLKKHAIDTILRWYDQYEKSRAQSQS
jgi:hypothetical protein